MKSANPIPEVKRHPLGGWTLAMPVAVGSSARTYWGSFPNESAAKEGLKTWKAKHLPPRAERGGQAQLDFSTPEFAAVA